MSQIDHTKTYFNEVINIAKQIDYNIISEMAFELSKLRNRNGRLFFVGVGGSAANCSHAVNDFRKICEIESYSPVDNISELTARTNDEGWDTIFSEWLKISQANHNDALFILSVGGGSKQKNISPNLVKAIDLAISKKITIFGIVGKDDGYTFQKGNYVLQVPIISEDRITPHSEAFQAVVWHCLVSNPLLVMKKTKWESETVK